MEENLETTVEQTTDYKLPLMCRLHKKGLFYKICRELLFTCYVIQDIYHDFIPRKPKEKKFNPNKSLYRHAQMSDVPPDSPLARGDPMQGKNPYE
ncbi:hypothetical protein ACFL1H_00145 [Nanoarchaeota archaeon]